MSDEVTARARRIRLVTLDVDGVLTDGRIYVDDDGRETKAFSALDGQGIKMLHDGGIVVAWITGSIAPAVAHRARHLGVAHVLTGAAEKVKPWEQLRASLGFRADACAHVGDDLPDVPLFAACGLAVSVPHEHSRSQDFSAAFLIADGLGDPRIAALVDPSQAARIPVHIAC